MREGLIAIPNVFKQLQVVIAELSKEQLYTMTKVVGLCEIKIRDTDKCEPMTKPTAWYSISPILLESGEITRSIISRAAVGIT